MKLKAILLLFFSITFHLSFTVYAQNEEILVAQKPTTVVSKSSRTLGINYKLSGDKSKLILLSDDQVEIWNTNSRRILLKKEHESVRKITNFEINYSGNIYALFKSNPKIKKNHIIEFYRIREHKPFLSLDSKSNNLVDAFTKIRFNKQGDKFAVIHKEHGIEIYQSNEGDFSVLKHLKPNTSFFMSILDFEFSNDDTHFFIYSGSDIKYDEPVVYQKWNLNSFELEEKVVSKDFGIDTWGINQVYSNMGHKIATPGWNLEKGLFVNCKYMQSLSRSKRVGNINPNDKSYLEVYSTTSDKTINLLSHKYIFNEAIIADSETVITSDERRNIHVWNIKTGQLINSLKTNDIIKKEDFDLSFMKKTSRINIMRVDPYKKEVYYSISSLKVIHVWNYEYNTDEIFQSNIVKVESPFFTSDSTIIYKKGMYLEHFDFKNQKAIGLKKENNKRKLFSFIYSRTGNKGITKTNGSLKLWSAKPLAVTDSIQIPESPFYPYYINKDLNYLALVVSKDIKNMFSSLEENPNKPPDYDKMGANLLKHFLNKMIKLDGSKVDPQRVKIKLYQIKDSSFTPIREIIVPGYLIQKIDFVPKTSQMLICTFNLPVSYQLEHYTTFINYIYDIDHNTLKALPKEVDGITKIIPSTNTIFSLKHNDNNLNEVKIINLNTQKIIKQFTFTQKGIRNNGKFDFINKNKVFIYGKKNNFIVDLTTRKHRIAKGSINNFDRNDDQKLLVAANGSLAFYNGTFKNKLYNKYYHIDNHSSITILPNNYYSIKGKGYELVSLFKNNKIYGFEQFDLKYHRPDLVIASIKETISDSIYSTKELYELAYKKRLQRIGKKEEELQYDNVPELTITNKSLLPNKTDNQVIHIDVKATDRKYQLKNLQISVNGVLIRNPDYELKEKSFSKTVPLVLSNKKNKILISVINEQGTSSDQEEIHIEYVGQPISSDLYIVSLGVSEYQHLKNTPNSSKDAQKIAEAFKQINKTTIKSLSLINEQVTQNNLKQISEFLSQAKENDVILFFVSGHAIQAKSEYFFCTSTSKIDNITTTGITYTDFDDLLGNTRSRNRLLILNTCYSGEVFEANTIKEIEAVNLMRKVFEDLKLTNGTTVISASEGTNKYYESNTKGNGIITLAILDILNLKEKITVQEFCKDIIQFCTAKSNEDPFESKLNKNIPLIRHNNIYNNFRMW
ncbi:caspase family protein [Aquimarina sp. Aq78]|uniref:caspase family protein n=1 Tax=Aquimarina sp. Aq78 TaxID=1191889 RepID=UPI000D0FAE2F|nr:caspase family protein [Aquimarina sp. Aq78]